MAGLPPALVASNRGVFNGTGYFSLIEKAQAWLVHEPPPSPIIKILLSFCDHCTWRMNRKLLLPIHLSYGMGTYKTISSRVLKTASDLAWHCLRIDPHTHVFPWSLKVQLWRMWVSLYLHLFYHWQRIPTYVKVHTVSAQPVILPICQVLPVCSSQPPGHSRLWSLHLLYQAAQGCVVPLRGSSHHQGNAGGRSQKWRVGGHLSMGQNSQRENFYAWAQRHIQK